MYCKLFKVINNDGLVDKVENLEINERVLIFDVRIHGTLVLKKNTGDILSFEKILNFLFSGVFIIKTENHTWIFELD